MYFYLLRRRHNEGSYDENLGFIIVANSGNEAREIAEMQAGDEPKGTWLDKDRSSCVILDSVCYDKAEVILCDFAAG